MRAYQLSKQKKFLNIPLHVFLIMTNNSLTPRQYLRKINARLLSLPFKLFKYVTTFRIFKS